MIEEEENLFVIHDLYSLITPHIPCDQSKIVRVNYSRLKFKDQYGSTLLKLIVELINTTTGENWTLQAIAKTLPRNSILHDLNETRAIFKKQVGIYMSAKKAIDNFLKEKGVRDTREIFINSFGGRINLNGTNEVDNNAALIITDLIVRGYRYAHRRTGFDLETSKDILAVLAKFHASTVGLKLTKPKEFKEKVMTYLRLKSLPCDIEPIARNHLVQVLNNEKFSTEVVRRALKTFDKCVSEEAREPWATFTHSNLSVLNILVKYNKKKQLEDIKIKGFQESQYSSPLKDLISFLFTSVQLVVLKQHLDELVDFYYENFTRFLSSLYVNLEPFSFPSFEEELKETASKGEFYKIVCKLYVVLNSNMEIQTGNEELKDPLHIRRLCYIVTEFDKRHWLS